METKSLSEILKSSYVVIPEIQREYVWGNNKDIFGKFIDNIIESHKASKDLNVGFLYSYYPFCSHCSSYREIHIIDGQQRFTSLFLLALYTAKQSGQWDVFQQLHQANRITQHSHFNYRVRQTSSAFLLDLLHYAGQEKFDFKNIPNYIWFLERYKSDSTVKAMLVALETIHEKLKNSPKDTLYQFIVDRVKFWYFNVEQTSQGEELYITMNSRGVTLTPSENIKPLLLRKCKQEEKQVFAKRMDLWDDFFWEIPEKENGRGIKFDHYFDQFLELVLQCETGKEKHLKHSNPDLSFNVEEKEQLTFEKLELYVVALINIEEIIKNNSKELQIEENLVADFLNEPSANNRIPLISLLLFVKSEKVIERVYEVKDYIQSYTNGELREFARIYHFFRNSVRRGRTEQNSIIRLLKDQNITIQQYIKTEDIQIDKLLNVEYEETNENRTLRLLLSEHELEKLKIASESPIREVLENSFWKAEESTNYILGGSLEILFTAMNLDIKKVWLDAELNCFNKVVSTLLNVFSKDNITSKLSDENSTINNSLLTRALLTIDDYSMHIKGSLWSFGHGADWKSILSTDRGKVVADLLCILNATTDLNHKEVLNTQIRLFEEVNEDKPKTWRYYFVKYKEMTIPANDGYNKFAWHSNYNVRILNKGNLKAYNTDPYIWVLRQKQPKLYQKGGYAIGHNSKYLEMKNGLQIVTADELNTWIVRVPSNLVVITDFSTLSKKYRECKTEHTDYDDYFFQYAATDDFIELGIELMKEIAQVETKGQPAP